MKIPDPQGAQEQNDISDVLDRAHDRIQELFEHSITEALRQSIGILNMVNEPSSEYTANSATTTASSAPTVPVVTHTQSPILHQAEPPRHRLLRSRHSQVLG